MVGAPLIEGDDEKQYLVVGPGLSEGGRRHGGCRGMGVSGDGAG